MCILDELSSNLINKNIHLFKADTIDLDYGKVVAGDWEMWKGKGMTYAQITLQMEHFSSSFFFFFASLLNFLIRKLTEHIFNFLCKSVFIRKKEKQNRMKS